MTGGLKMSERKIALTEKELIEKYKLNEEEQKYLLPLMVEIENAFKRHLTGLQ
jgi:hypothetical protein